MAWRPKVLIFAYAQDHLGFGRLSRSLVAALANFCEAHLAAPDLFSPEQPQGWTLHHNPDVFDVHGLRHLLRVVSRLQPDIALLISDYWLLARGVLCVRSVSRAKVILYFPFDGGVRKDAPHVHLGDPDWMVVYNHFSRNQLLAANADGRIQTQRLPERLSVIGHGVDPCQFYPKPDRARVRREFFRSMPVGTDDFIVLNANRNGPRKRADLTLEGFALFARNKPLNVKLCLNMGLKEFGVDLLRAIRSLGLRDRVLLTAQTAQHPRLSIDRLNLLFNACDVGISTSLGEGWGLVPFEHGLTGSAQVVPAHTAFVELWTGFAEMMPPHRTVPLSFLLEGWAVTPGAVARALDRLYSDRQHLLRLQDAARARASQPEFAWGTVAQAWNSVFQQALGASS